MTTAITGSSGPAEILTGGYDDIEDYIRRHAPRARLLGEITAELDDDYHTVWLDGRDVWHAWRDLAADEVWHLEREPAGEALEWLREQLSPPFDRMGDPGLYAGDPRGSRLVARDEAVMEEYYEVELAALGGLDPVATDRLIVRRITAARAEVARLSSLRAHHLRRAWQGDGDRGWQTRAAQSLGISPQAITKVLSSDDRRASARRRAARLRGWLSG